MFWDSVAEVLLLLWSFLSLVLLVTRISGGLLAAAGALVFVLAAIFSLL